jgi:hypothetical protein
LVPPEPPQARQRGSTRILLLCAVVVLLSGWFESAYALFLIGLAPSAVLALYGFGIEIRGASNTTRLVRLASVVVSATLLLLAWRSGINGLTLGMLAAAIGYIVISCRSDEKPGPRRKARDEILRTIVEPVRAADGAIEARIEPCFPVSTSDEETIWAIDPARRVLRVMAPANAEVDELVKWDEPIRAVTLKRVELSRWWPSSESRIRAIRRDRNLEVTCGRDEAAKWRYVFEFAGRDMAERWREVFEGWMIKDRERISA